MRLPEGNPDQADRDNLYLLTVTIKDFVTFRELYSAVWQRRWDPKTGWEMGIRIPESRIAPPEKQGDPK